MAIIDQQANTKRSLLIFLVALFSQIAGIIILLGQAASYFILGSWLDSTDVVAAASLVGPGYFFPFISLPILALALITISIGLFGVRMWALYGYTALAAMTIVLALYAFSMGRPGPDFLSTTVVILGAVILWAHRRRFVK